MLRAQGLGAVLAVAVSCGAGCTPEPPPPAPIENAPSPFAGERAAPSSVAPTSRPWRQARELALGEEFICALSDDGALYCWGSERYGELGDGAPQESEKLRPEQANGRVFRAEDIAANRGFACSLERDGGVACWGNNHYGQLGDGASENQASPLPVRAVEGAVEIAVGGRHACALRRDGAVLCWGANASGQLGESMPERVSVARAIEAPGAVAELALGNQSTCVRLRDGHVECVGSNAFGELGRGVDVNELASSGVFRRVEGLPAVIQLEGYANHFCALTEERTVYCWGGMTPPSARALRQRERRISAELPVDPLPDIGTPKRVEGLDDVIELAVGLDFTCGRQLRGAVYCWGSNEFGQLGSGSQSDRDEPSPVASLHDAIAIYAGSRNACARLSDNQMHCWGSNRGGQLGNGGTVTSLVPTEVLEPLSGDQ